MPTVGAYHMMYSGLSLKRKVSGHLRDGGACLVLYGIYITIEMLISV